MRTLGPVGPVVRQQVRVLLADHRLVGGHDVPLFGVSDHGQFLEGDLPVPGVLADLDNSTWANLTGAGGHAFDATYRDQAQAWATGQQYPGAFSRQAVEASARDFLVLQPAS